MEMACPEMVRPRSEARNNIWSASCRAVTKVRMEFIASACASISLAATFLARAFPSNTR